VFPLRSATRSDDDAVLRVLAAREMRDFGSPGSIRELLLAGWRVARVERSTDAVVAEDGRTIAGYAALFPQGAIAFVDPSHEGLGIGSSLLRWVEARAAEDGRSCHRQPVAGGNASAHRLLSAAGYRHVRSVSKMAVSLPVKATVPPAPPGIVFDRLDVAHDAHALHAADESAFAENPDYEPVAFEAFRHEHLEAPDLDPGLSGVARRGDEVAGFILCRRSEGGVGYVDLLAVAKPERSQGLGTALLSAAFAGFARVGLREAQLEVASDNPRALRIYERAGMVPLQQLDVFEKPAASGR
jgi:mycothiol synthase